MNKRNWLLNFVALVLAGVYVFYFTSWFKPKIIHIIHTSRNVSSHFRNNANLDALTVPIEFKLGRPYKLTELKVVVRDEWLTNKDCLPLWHLIADTNSVPITRPFFYGQRIRGMKPVVPGKRAQPLQPGVTYRLFVTDGSASGEHDFQPRANSAATDQSVR